MTADSNSPKAAELESRRTSVGISKKAIAVAAVLATAAIWAYWPTLARVVSTWWSNPDYSHGFLVVPISLWILWTRRQHVPQIRLGLNWIGFSLIVLAGLLRFLAGRLYLPDLDAWSIPVWIGGVVWLLAGWPFFRWALPGLAFLYFAAPLPGTVEIFLSTPLQRIATSLSATVLQILGQPAIAEGTTILLDDQVLDIERACSGLRMFLGVIALAFGCIAILRPSVWKSVVILLSAGFIAILTNVARITLTGLLLRFVSGEAAQQFSHDFAGLVMIPLAVALFVVLYLLLSKMSARFQSDGLGATAWLARWVVGIGVLLGGVFFWARFQQERALGTLLETAGRLEREEDFRGAIEYLTRCIAARPQEAVARIKLAELYGKVATSRDEKLKFLHASRTAWQYRPDRYDLGMQAAKTAYELQDYPLAISLCNSIAEVDSPADQNTKTAAIKLKASALYDFAKSETSVGSITWPTVFKSLQEAMELADFKVKHAAARAEVYRDRLSEPEAIERQKQADVWMDELIEAKSDDPAAWLARYQYRLRYSDYHDGKSADTPDDDLRRAAEVAKANPGKVSLIVMLIAAARDQELNKTASAIGYLREAIAMAPDDYRPYTALALIQRQPATSESRAEAIATLRRGIAKCGSDQLGLLLPLASVLAESGDFSGAEAELAPIEKVLPNIVGSNRGRISLEIGLVKAQIIASRDGPLAGVGWLRQLLADPDVQRVQRDWPTGVARVWSMMGQLYVTLDSPDQAVEAFEQCSRFDPSAAWQQPLGTAALAAGHLDTAERYFRSIASGRAPQSEALLALAQIEVLRQSQASAGQQDWTTFDELLQNAKQFPKPVLMLLQAQKLVAQGDAVDGARLLDSAIADFPEELSLWRGLVVARGAAGDQKGALAAVDRLAELGEDSTNLTLQRATLLSRIGRLEEAQELLEAAATSVDTVKKPIVAEALARFHLQQGAHAKAVQVLEEAHSATPQNLQVTDLLANLAWLSNDVQSLKKYEQWLRQTEGEFGSFWRAHRAQRLLMSAKSSTDSAFSEAVQLAEALNRDRPYWWKTHYLQGEIALRSGHDSAAIAAYERAWRSGGRNALVADRLTDLLTRAHRVDEARRFVGQIGDLLRQSPMLFDRAIPFYPQGQANADAVRTAEQWANLRPSDAGAQLRLGRVLMLTAPKDDEQEYARSMERAEQHLQKAIELAPNDVGPWIALTVYYGQSSGTRQKALEVLEQLRDRTEIDELRRAYLLAQLYDGLGTPSESQDWYLKAVQLAKTSEDTQLATEILVRAARFFIDRSELLAERFSRQAIAIDSSSTAAKQVLVESLARRTDDAALQEALSILESIGIDDSRGVGSNFQRRLRALLLARRNGPDDVSRAIKLIDEILEKSPDDKLLLAKLYEVSGRPEPAFALLDELASDPSPRPKDLTEFLRFWQSNFLSRKDVDGTRDQFGAQAQQVYQVLGRMPGQRYERLRWELREVRARLGIDAVTAIAANDAVKSIIEDEQIRKLESDSERQRAFRQILVVLLEEKASAAAYQLVANIPPWLDEQRALIELCNALIIAQPSLEIRAPAESLLSEAMQRTNVDPALVQAIGNYRYMYEDYAGAADAFSRVAELDPAHRITALNNLALAIVEQPGKAGEATRILDQALAQSPDDLVLRDTKAVLALIANRPDEALQIFEQIAERSSGDAGFHLRRSMAHTMLGQLEQAQRSYFQALGLGIENELLAPRDRQYLNTIRGKYSGSVAGL